MRFIVICGLWGLQCIGSHYLIKDTIFEKSYRTWSVCSDFVRNICLKHFHTKKNSSIYDHKCISVLMKLEFYGQIF